MKIKNKRMIETIQLLKNKRMVETTELFNEETKKQNM
jgi:hypothetical protein